MNKKQFFMASADLGSDTASNNNTNVNGKTFNAYPIGDPDGDEMMGDINPYGDELANLGDVESVGDYLSTDGDFEVEAAGDVSRRRKRLAMNPSAKRYARKHSRQLRNAGFLVRGSKVEIVSVLSGKKFTQNIPIGKGVDAGQLGQLLQLQRAITPFAAFTASGAASTFTSGSPLNVAPASGIVYASFMDTIISSSELNRDSGFQIGLNIAFGGAFYGIGGAPATVLTVTVSFGEDHMIVVRNLFYRIVNGEFYATLIPVGDGVVATGGLTAAEQIGVYFNAGMSSSLNVSATIFGPEDLRWKKIAKAFPTV